MVNTVREFEFSGISFLAKCFGKLLLFYFVIQFRNNNCLTVGRCFNFNLEIT